FWSKFYGPAAEPMRQYWMTIDEGFSTLKSEAGSYFSLHLVYTPENLSRLDGYLDEAARAAGDDMMVAKRVELARKGFAMAEDYMAWREHVNAGRMQEAKVITDRMDEASREDRWCYHNKT